MTNLVIGSRGDNEQSSYDATHRGDPICIVFLLAELPICGARALINLTGMNVKLVHISKNTTPMDVSVVVVGAGASGLVAAMAVLN